MLNSAYNFKKEEVHVVDPRDGRLNNYLDCSRCSRSLPENCFGIVGESWRDRRHLRRLVLLHPWCHICRRQQYGSWTSHELYSPALDRYWQKYLSGVKSRARACGMLVGVDKDDLLGMYLEQNELCAVTGLKMDWRSKGRVGSGHRARAAPSVDRISSRGNYVRGNIQIVMQIVNIMKTDMDMEMFIGMCRRISERSMLGEISGNA